MKQHAILFSLVSAGVGILLSFALAWLIGHEETRITLVGPSATAQASLFSLTASLALLCFIVPLSWWAVKFTQAWYFIRKSGWKVGLLKYKREHCEHVWVYDLENDAIRTCSMCKHHERRESVPYFTGGEISYGWYPQNPDELRFR